MQYYFRGFGFLILFLIIFAFVFFNWKKGKELYDLRKKFINESDYVKKRKLEIYNIIKNNNTFRNKYIQKLLISVVASFVVLLISYKYLMKLGDYSIILAILTLGACAWCYKIILDYDKEFKDKVIREIFNKYNSNLIYTIDKGIEENEYKKLNFPEKYNIYKSTDLIEDNSIGFKFATLVLERDNGDDTSHLFNGSIACININNIGCQIILGNTKKLISFNMDKAITFEDGEFNNLYGTMSDNIDVAKRILNKDVRAKLVSLKKNVIGDIDIRIVNDKIFVRFNVVGGFKPNLLFKNMEMNNIVSSLVELDEVIRIMKYLKETIENSTNNQNYEVL